ncbi:FAD-dependent oxidoreductase [Sphaerisporangium dianthi]|uniref:FAD-dependent oxidoreductase n=1 Tax=Sphaerisporangium dianthi TaxID=1436120 RepID=A0ABV9CTL8_9ACTN
MTRALVLGGGLSGVLAAVALSRHVDEVTVIEGDRLPDGPRPRRGLPQGQQAHMLMAGGAQALDQLLPGTTARLYAAGAHRLTMAGHILTLSGEGWFERFDHDAYLISCSRHLIDHVVRQLAFRDDSITVIESTKVIALTGDAKRVTGARVEHQGGEERTISADFVVDATGSRSRAPQWLADLGLPQVREEFLDAGLAYAGRWYEAPAEAADGLPAVLIQPEPRSGRPGYGAGLLPQEDGKWIVPLIGTRGGQPPTDGDGFLEFARGVRHPLVADLIATARPIGEIRASRGLANRRRLYDRLPVPEGFLAIGDSATVLSPNYATGMSLAALGALSLRTRLKNHGLTPGLSRQVQSDIAKLATGPWRTAIGNDRWFPGVKTNMKLGGGGFQRWFASRWMKTAAVDPKLLAATYEVATLRASQSSMMSLPMLTTVLRGPRRGPLTAAEALARFPEFDELLAAVAESAAAERVTG